MNFNVVWQGFHRAFSLAVMSCLLFTSPDVWRIMLLRWSWTVLDASISQSREHEGTAFMNIYGSIGATLPDKYWQISLVGLSVCRGFWTETHKNKLAKRLSQTRHQQSSKSSLVIHRIHSHSVTGCTLCPGTPSAKEHHPVMYRLICLCKTRANWRERSLWGLAYWSFCYPTFQASSSLCACNIFYMYNYDIIYI